MNKLLFILLVLGSASCRQAKTNASTTFPDDKATVIEAPWFKDTNHVVFKPSEDEIIQVDSLLQRAIDDKKFLFLEEQSLKCLKERYRQYFFFINDKNEKQVYIISFCRVQEIYKDGKMQPYDWKNKVLIVKDGGSCYWRIELNLTTNRYFEPNVNGEA